MQNARINRLLEAQDETGQTIGRLMLTLLGIALVVLLTLGFPDSYLLTTATTVSIPFAGPASFKSLLVLAPILLIAVRLYLQIYIEHWYRLRHLTQRFSTRRKPLVSPLQHRLLFIFYVFVRYFLVSVVLGVLTWEAMVFPAWGLALLMVTTASIVVLLLQLLPWDWPFKVMALLLVGGIFAYALYEGAFDHFRRPFRLQLANLERAVLQGQDLRGADLRGANLQKANLKLANMQESNLEGADIEDANLVLANLGKATLLNANLEKANLCGATLQDAKLKNAKLGHAILESTNLRRVLLGQANLRDADLIRASLQGANLWATNVERARLWFANLEGAYVHDANITDATFCKTTMPDGRINNGGCEGLETEHEQARPAAEDCDPAS